MCYIYFPIFIYIILYTPYIPIAGIALISWSGGYRAKQLCLHRIALRMDDEVRKRKELQCPDIAEHLYRIHSPIVSNDQDIDINTPR